MQPLRLCAGYKYAYLLTYFALRFATFRLRKSRFGLLLQASAQSCVTPFAAAAVDWIGNDTMHVYDRDELLLLYTTARPSAAAADCVRALGLNDIGLLSSLP